MNTFFKTLMATGLVAFLMLASGCGQSSTEKELLAQNSMFRDVASLFEQVRNASTGDVAAATVVKLQERVGGTEQLPQVGISSVELKQIVADKYFADAKGQLTVLRDRRTGTDKADKARAEFYRTQKLSGRGLGPFGVTAKTIDALVAQADHRAETANSPKTAALNHATPRPTRKTR